MDGDAGFGRDGKKLLRFARDRKLCSHNRQRLEGTQLREEEKWLVIKIIHSSIQLLPQNGN